MDFSNEGWVLYVVGKGKKECVVLVFDLYIENVLGRYWELMGLFFFFRIDEDILIFLFMKIGKVFK